MSILVTIIFIVWIVARILPVTSGMGGLRRFRKRKYMPSIFDSYYLDGKSFYMYCFRNIPCITYTDDIDIGLRLRIYRKIVKDLLLIFTRHACTTG
jgi:hypothetical protein